MVLRLLAAPLTVVPVEAPPLTLAPVETPALTVAAVDTGPAVVADEAAVVADEAAVVPGFAADPAVDVDVAPFCNAECRVECLKALFPLTLLKSHRMCQRRTTVPVQI